MLVWVQALLLLLSLPRRPPLSCLPEETSARREQGTTCQPSVALGLAALLRVQANEGQGLSMRNK